MQIHTMQIHTWLLPELIRPGELEGAAAVVIDIVRASTTISVALANGATRVIPCLEIDEARQRAAELGSQAILGGERGGIRVEGFDCGNSPTEYSREVVAARTVCFTTTNGTRALSGCHEARRVLIGAFVNRQQLVQRLLAEERIGLVCAGTNGAITREDVLGAGAIIDGLVQAAGSCELDDSSRLALAAWQSLAGRSLAGQSLVSESAEETQAMLAGELTRTQGGRNLQRIGQDADLRLVAQLDSLSAVPVLFDDGLRLDVPGGPEAST